MAVLDLGKVVPEKGVDYFTQADIDGVIADVKSDVKVSDLQNDAGYITKDVNDLTNYTLATDTGATIELSINSSTYVMTLNLKNSAGTIISFDSIDLPLETMVIGATYDNTNKKIVLTLKNGTTLDVPVGDLVSGLQTEITSQNKLSSDLVDDTNKTNKFVTASEKTTWSGKQDALVSGTNIKTINNESVLGSGDITISSSKNVAFIGSNYIMDLTLANAQEIVDVMFANNIDTIYLNENKTGYKNGDICFANITPILSSSTTSYVFYLYSQTPNYNFTNIYWSRQDYNVTISWNNNMPVVTAITKNGSVKSNYIRMDGEQQSWTPSTNYSPVPKKYVDDATNEVKTQYTTMPTANASNLGKIAQYIGTTTSSYTNGYYYQVVSDGASTPTYSWQNINVQAGSQANVHYITENDSTHPFVFAEHELGAYIFPNANDSIYVKGTNENTNNVNVVYSKGVILDYFKLYSEASSQEVFARTNYSRLYKNDTGRYTELLHTFKKNTSAPTGVYDDTGGTEFHFVEPDTTQSITALKTFTVLPQSSVTPSDNKDFVTKAYVDSKAGGISVVNVTDGDVEFPDETSDAKWDEIFTKLSEKSGSVIIVRNDFQVSIRTEFYTYGTNKIIQMVFPETFGTKYQLGGTNDYAIECELKYINMEYDTSQDEHWHRTNDNFSGRNNVKMLVNSYMDVYGTAPDPASIRFVFNLLGISEYQYSGNYSVGDYVYYENVIYKCNTATTEEDFDSSKWDASTYIAYLNDNLAL